MTKPGGVQSVAMYLQDAHPIREAMSFVQYAEAKGFDAVYRCQLSTKCICLE